MGKKDAPKILYKLWKDEYLHMEKFVVTGARQSQFLSWKVNKPSLWEHVLDEMLHAALNLSQRVAYEWEKEIEEPQLAESTHSSSPPLYNENWRSLILIQNPNSNSSLMPLGFLQQSPSSRIRVNSLITTRTGGVRSRSRTRTPIPPSCR
ncbi:DNA-directed RNA polymerase III subunit rpc-3 isoform X2 [Fagus crenata]